MTYPNRRDKRRLGGVPGFIVLAEARGRRLTMMMVVFEIGCGCGCVLCGLCARENERDKRVSRERAREWESAERELIVRERKEGHGERRETKDQSHKVGPTWLTN